MSAAHLHAVPDPEPEPPVDDQLEIAPVGDDDGGEEHSGWIPSLRPYYDVRPLAELGPLAVEVSRVGGPPLLRATGRGLRALARGLLVLARGVGVLLVLLAGWLSGNNGRGSIGARFAGAGFVAYAVAKTATRYPYARWFVLLALLAAVILAGLGHIKAPEPKAQKKTPAKKGAGKKSKRAPAEDDDAEPPEVSKENAPAEHRRGLLGRLSRRLKSGGDTPAKPSPDDSDGEDDETPLVEPTPDPSREDLAGALHHLYRGGSGVLHTALAEHLPLPSTKAVKRVLDRAGIAHRPGVRTPAGNGPGVHHHDFPPLPLPQEGPQGERCLRSSAATPTPTTAPTAPEEGFVAYRTEWNREETANGFRSVPDPERGPSASRIEYRRQT
ncbi:hypothetical protein OG763_15040 [Streptomyces sp. NBC_01230]|uniref:hypothetical protein n=1 Tax=Streptomyces sp. NBC_01230 TaxID=2903784 RepID=UPI002E0DA1A7|nr:hypothetical protein OG763_15040 [Streptomyces sp. NBC_01230]